MEARLPAVLALSYLLAIALQGCDDSSPTPQRKPSKPAESTCYEGKGFVHDAYNVSCNGTQTPKATPIGVIVHYFIGKEQLEQFTFELTTAQLRYQTLSAADIVQSEKGYTLTLHPSGPIGESWCMSVTTTPPGKATGLPSRVELLGGSLAHKCPSCSKNESSHANFYDSFVLAQMEGGHAGVPCPGKVAGSLRKVTSPLLSSPTAASLV